MQSITRSYLESWSQELVSRTNRVRDLIDDKHWLTDGHHKEFLVRDFLKRYLGSELVITTGFIKSFPKNSISSEVDILVTNPSLEPPYFNEGGIQIVSPDSVVGILEIKSTFSKSALEDSIKKIIKAKKILGENGRDCWSCIWFANSEKAKSTAINATFDLVKNNYNTEKDLEHLLPSCISTFDKFIIFPKSKGGKRFSIYYFETRLSSVAVTVFDLFDHIKARHGNTSSNELGKEIENEFPPSCKNGEL